jgi:hypothetical protein
MEKILVILFMALPALLTGKETKKVVRQNYYPPYKETYYILKSDTAIKHGSYKAEAAERVLAEGYYNMGYMDSIWTHYNIQGKIQARGCYVKSKRDGIWEFFDNKGELEQKIDFTNNLVLQYKTTFANHIFKIFTGKDTLLSKLERPPLYIGGSNWFSGYVEQELCLPLHKPQEKVNGVVYVGFLIDSLGVTSNHRVLKGLGRVCNNEALRVMKAIPDDWMPGVYEGKFVSTEYVVIILFDENTRTMEF